MTVARTEFEHEGTGIGRAIGWIAAALVAAALIGAAVHHMASGFLTAQGLAENDRKSVLLMSASLEDVLSEDRPRLETTIELFAERDPSFYAINITDEDGGSLLSWQRSTPPQSQKFLMFFKRFYVPQRSVKPIVLEGETYGAMTMQWDRSAQGLMVDKQALLAASTVAGLCFPLCPGWLPHRAPTRLSFHAPAYCRGRSNSRCRSNPHHRGSSGRFFDLGHISLDSGLTRLPDQGILEKSGKPDFDIIVAPDAGENVGVRHVGEETRLDLQVHVLAEPAFGLDADGSRLGVAVYDGAGQDLRVVDVVERQARADEEVVVERRGRRLVLVAAVVEIFGQKSQIRVAAEQAKQGVLETGDGGVDALALSAAGDRLQLEQPGIERGLNVEAGLIDDVVLSAPAPVRPIRSWAAGVPRGWCRRTGKGRCPNRRSPGTSGRRNRRAPA